MRNSLKVLLGTMVIGIGMVGSAQAAASVRGAKQATNINFTTTVSTIAIGPAVLYGVVLSTPATAGDYTAFFDSASAIGLTATNAGATLKFKIIASTTLPVILTFDPPIQFLNGIMAGNSVATNTSSILFEKGRIPQGY